MSRPSITGNCVFKWTLLQSGWAKEPASSWLRRFTALGQRFAHLSGKAMAVPAEGPLASEGLRSQVSRSPVSSPSPQYVFFCSSWPQSEAQLPAHSFLGQIEERTLRVQRPSPPPRPRTFGEEPGCVLNTTSDVVVIQQEERPGRKAKGEDIVWVQSVFAIFHIGSFYECSRNKTTAAN